MIYKMAKATFRSLIPKRMRRGLSRHSGPLGKLAVRVKDRMRQSASHDEIYDQEYYVSEDSYSTASAPQMVRDIDLEFSPLTVVDVGCGVGAFLMEFKRRNPKVH